MSRTSDSLREVFKGFFKALKSLKSIITDLEDGMQEPQARAIKFERPSQATDDEKKSADPDKIAATPTRAAEKKGTSTTAAKAAAAGATVADPPAKVPTSKGTHAAAKTTTAHASATRKHASSAEVKVKVEKGVRTEPQTVYELSDSDLDASAPGSGIIGLDDSESDKESEQPEPVVHVPHDRVKPGPSATGGSPVIPKPAAAPAITPKSRRCNAIKLSDGVQCLNTSITPKVVIDVNGRCQFHADLGKFQSVVVEATGEAAGPVPVKGTSPDSGRTGPAAGAPSKGASAVKCNAERKDGTPCQNTSALLHIDANGRCPYHANTERFQNAPVLTGNLLASSNFTVGSPKTKGSELAEVRTHGAKESPMRAPVHNDDPESVVVLDDMSVSESDGSASDDNSDYSPPTLKAAVRTVVESQTRARKDHVWQVKGTVCGTGSKSAKPLLNSKGLGQNFESGSESEQESDGEPESHKPVPTVTTSGRSRHRPHATSNDSDSENDMPPLVSAVPVPSKPVGSRKAHRVRFEEPAAKPQAEVVTVPGRASKAATAAGVGHGSKAIPEPASAESGTKQLDKKAQRKRTLPVEPPKPWDSVKGVPAGVVSEELWNAFPKTQDVSAYYKCLGCETVFAWDFVHYSCSGRSGLAPLPSDIKHWKKAGKPMAPAPTSDSGWDTDRDEAKAPSGTDDRGPDKAKRSRSKRGAKPKPHDDPDTHTARAGGKSKSSKHDVDTTRAPEGSASGSVSKRQRTTNPE